MNVTYYPGCSLEGTARDYADSIHGVCAALDIRLQEVPDWNCCGATAAHCIDHAASIGLPARNLKQAAQLPNSDMLVPCPMCFNRLRTAVWEQKEKGAQTDAELPQIWDLANFFAAEGMIRKLSAQVRKPLKGLNVVCYYGCMASRPPHITGATDYENPQSLDRIVAALGGTSVAWPYKTDCCGASLMISRPDMSYKLVGKLYDMAKRVGAQAIVVSCQMCQANLDMYQDKIEAEMSRLFRLPIIYFTELIGLAFGLPGTKGWLSRHFTDPLPLLRKGGLLD